jgi:hypothetical protein
MPGSRISFEQFGINFMDRVLTPKRVNDSLGMVLRRAKPEDLHGTKTFEGKTVRFMAVLDPPETSRVVQASVLTFTARLPMGVSIEVLDLPDKPNYTLRVEVTLTLNAMACAPLFVVIKPEPVTFHSVRVLVEEKDEGFVTWLVGLALGNVEQQVIDGVRQSIAAMVAKAIAGAADTLTVDVEQMANQSLAAEGGAKESNR